MYLQIDDNALQPLARTSYCVSLHKSIKIGNNSFWSLL